MDERKIKNLVKVWYDKANAETDIFSKFLFLWVCFNAWLAYRTTKPTDRAMIECLKRRSHRVLDMLNEYDRAFNSTGFKDKIQELKNLSLISDPTGRRPPITIRNICNFDEICEAIYRIRCTLFHGGKSASRNRDVKLVKVAGDILQKWVGNLVNSW